MFAILRSRVSTALLVLGAVVGVFPASAQEARAICEGGRYPGNGDFEVARIAAGTPVIEDFAQKKLSSRRPYAEADAVVVVWNRSGQFACVESPTGLPETYFWVDRNALRTISDGVDGKNRWTGTYGDPPVIKVTSVGDGKYDVHGEVDHTHGDGPGWGYTISNEISASDAKPDANAIRVSLRRDVTTAGSKAPKDIPSPGFIDDRCKPLLFVKGPVLLIKDTGDCGDGSAFQGYIVRG